VTRRYDTSAVPLQGGYVAKQCPVRAQNDLLVPGVPVETGAFQQRLFDNGNAFEDISVAEILLGTPETVAIEGRGVEAEDATLAAMRDGAPIILNGRLIDTAGRRVGKPDLLIRAGDGGYRVADIKWHMALELAKASGNPDPALLSSIASIDRESALLDMDFVVRRHEGDALQLAHYQRMLEALGFAATDGRFAAIIGTERRAVWYDLDKPMWKTASISETSKLRSTMERYDFEFDFRLDVIAVAQQHQVDATVPLLVVPVRISECPSCPWSAYCGPILDTPPGDVSLVPRVGWALWKAHRDRGVRNRADLASLDTRTAQLVAARIDVAGLMEAVSDSNPSTPVLDLTALWPRVKQLQQLHDAGVATVADLLSLDAPTALYSNAGIASLVEQIDQARAALGAEPAYRRRGIDAVRVRRADVEVDIDMESTELGAYLWGALVSHGSSPESEYVPFVAWDPMSSDEEPAHALLFWQRLTGLRSATAAAGLTFCAYCWNASAENQYLRRIGRAWDIVDEVETFISSDEWVDLYRVWDANFITGSASGLKVVAPIVGFAWEVDDPGGGESMVMYDRALDVGADADAARAWLLLYNRGDVMATRAVREWMDTVGARAPSIASVGPRPG
jgi:predicted RecB family nuclease